MRKVKKIKITKTSLFDLALVNASLIVAAYVLAIAIY